MLPILKYRQKNKKLSAQIKFVTKVIMFRNVRKLEDILRFERINLNKKIKYRSGHIKWILILIGRK